MPTPLIVESGTYKATTTQYGLDAAAFTVLEY
jgi:hypothetical protein